MKVQQCCLFLMTVLSVQTSFALSFDTEDRHVQDYIVSQLVKAIKVKDQIVIVQSKIPSNWRIDSQEELPEISFLDAGLLGLCFNSVSPVEFLKGSISARIGGCALLYPLFHTARTDTRKGVYVYYRPDMTCDTMCRLVFVHPQLEPLDGWLFENPSALPNPEYCEQFLMDVRTLLSAEFLTKYKLGRVFSNSVYQVTEGCMFIVDHPLVKIPDEGTKRQHQVRDIRLSHQEVSEIVYLAYLEEDKGGGAATYAEMVRQSRILQPMPKAEFKTLIGQRLHAVLSDPEYGTAEKRAQEEKDRKQRELAERKAKLRAEIDMRMDAIEKAEQVTADDFIQFDVVFVQFSTLPTEEGKRASWDLERTDIRLRHFKLLMQKGPESAGTELALQTHRAWTRILVTLKDAHIQVNYVEQYDDIQRKVQGLSLNPKQVKEVEDAVAGMEANRKKYAR